MARSFKKDATISLRLLVTAAVTSIKDTHYQVDTARAWLKKKVVHETTTTDYKTLQSTLKRICVNGIPAIEEVNIFKDETVIQFLNELLVQL
ncbi:nascent polypeptide-associated complex subunit beta-like protein [Tanacetum coccineum]